MRRFLDTNVLVYANSSDTRQRQARACVTMDAVVSVQVLNEFASVLRRKQGRSWDEIEAAVADVLAVVAPVLPMTVATHRMGVLLTRDRGLSLYDALIVSAALEAGCGELLTEDMQDGRTIDHLTIRNPFR